MKKNLRKSLLAVALLLGGSAVAATSPVEYVNTLVGTQSNHALSTGNTYPAIALPWGMNFWMPQTGKMGDGWAYTYNADKIRGLKQTHQPSPWINDYGQFAIMPTIGTVFDENKRASWFSHKAETARPYYYKVYLADYDITAEVTPTERAAVMRFTYPNSKESRIVIDAFDNGSMVRIIDDRHIEGYTTKNSGGVPEGFKNYFVIESDKPFTFISTVTNGKIQAGERKFEGNHAGAVVGFQTARGEVVTLRVASSFISAEQARQNLKEVSGRSFDAVCRNGRDRWNNILGRLEVEDTNIDHLRTFYSCLYRSVLFPRMFHEVNQAGEIVHYSPYDGKVHTGRLFTDTGFWDTFRSLFPLLNLVYPEMSQQMQEGLVNTYKESDFLPEWASPGHRGCMVGNNSASVVADAYLKGMRGYDVETLWQAVKHGANAVHPQVSSTGRLGFDYYNRLGYVPYNVGINESVARTLEYAYDDWSIYRLGQALGKSKKELKPYMERAMNYQKVFDKETSLMRGRNEDGTFQSPFNPLKWGDAFTEGNAWHYTWSVFHDPAGLMRLMGGKNNFVSMLDSVFSVPPVFDESYYGAVIHEIREMQIMNMGNYAHGNQPIQHMIYLYDWAGEPWKSQYWVRQVMDRLYQATPDGYCGDEDNGQTSAWYVFSALGFYPVCPGSGQYALGTPYFKRVTMHLPEGKTMVISADGNYADNCYISEMLLNGAPYDKNYIEHSDLLAGGSIDFRMATKPNLQRGTQASSLPYSFSTEVTKPAIKPVKPKKEVCKTDAIVRPSNRPAEADRLFRSEAIEDEIKRIASLLTNARLAWMFTNCFPNTLDTTVHYEEDAEGNPDTFVYTGDIHAMWLRDSGAQVWPYVKLANKDPKLKKMLAGVILRQLKCINIDPYANAFNKEPRPDGEWMGDTGMKPELHERKWEIDSLCYVLRLLYEYWQTTGDNSVLGDEWIKAIQSILRTFRDQQRKDGRGSYQFLRKTDRALDTVNNGGWGAPVKPVGLIASTFRPSDDATTLLFLVPSNFMAVTSLNKAAEMLEKVSHRSDLAKQCSDLATEVSDALHKYAIYDHPKYGPIYAYEVDGFGNRVLMDDANVPSLLAMPYLGDVDINDPIYQNTRRFVWSEDNPYFFRGKAGEGIGGPHIGYDMPWPMSIMMKAFTSQSDAEIKWCIEMLMKTDAGKGFIHESFHKDDATNYTRDWFAWQNTLFGELIIKLVSDGKLDLLNSIR